MESGLKKGYDNNTHKNHQNEVSIKNIQVKSKLFALLPWKPRAFKSYDFYVSPI